MMYNSYLYLVLLIGTVGCMDIPIVSKDSVAYDVGTYQSPYSDFDEAFSGSGNRESQGYRKRYYHLNNYQSNSNKNNKNQFGFCPAEPTVQCERHSKYRTFDGSCNNLNHPWRGQGQTPYARILPQNNRFSFFQCANGDTRLPSSRDVSLHLVKRGDNDEHSVLSMYIMLWGQLLDHDMVLTPPRKTMAGDFVDCCHMKNKNHPDCCPVVTKPNDPFYSKNNRPNCQSVIRSRQIKKPNSMTHKRCEIGVENSNSAWIDASFLYGSTKKRADFLRTFKGGKMKVVRDRSHRKYPPFKKEKGRMKMEFGDSRGDSHLAFTMLNVAFLRFHNKLADNLSKLNPIWTDERVYQEARKIVGAIVQHITFTEFVPKILGKGSKLHLPYRQGYKNYYKPRVDGSVSIEFATAGFRLHSLISSWYDLVDSNYRVKSKLHLRDIFRSPLGLLNGTVYDDIMRGMAQQPLKEFNNIYTPEMTEWMLRKGSNDFGFDIAAITIQRGRDHQLKGYTAYREKCGLGRVSSWTGLMDLIPLEHINRIRRIYKRPADIDLDIGIVMEKTLPGTQIGPTSKCLVEDQLRRARDGDRYFYTRPGIFNSRQLYAIQSSCISDILCFGSDDYHRMSLPDNTFVHGISNHNPLISCRKRYKFDIGAWKTN